MGLLVAGAAALGLLIGSFLNVVVWRVPRGESVVTPGSHCPHCDAPIRPWDNIPVLSWLILRGRCRDCKAPISARYPLVELTTGIVFAGVTFHVLNSTIGVDPAAQPGGWWLPTVLTVLAFLYLAAVSIALILIDLEHHRLPNSIVLPSYIVGILLLTAASLTAGDHPAILRAGIGMAALFAGYLAVALIRPGGMGMGDVKLAGVLGLYLAWCGWGQFAVGVFAAFLLGGLYSVVLLVIRRANRKTAIPFGPWMIIGAWIGIGLGAHIWAGYLASFGIVN
ncbi:MAG TPA: prepilin peptidase [Terrimesophilobacter sp.]|nr:prepilin peptidase [Terrimesophilobacter sp.]